MITFPATRKQVVAASASLNPGAMGEGTERMSHNCNYYKLTGHKTREKKGEFEKNETRPEDLSQSN